MKKILARVFFIALTILLFTSCIKGGGSGNGYEEYNLVNVGDYTPYFTVYDKDGNSFSHESGQSSQLLGKRSLILFFQTTCGDCKAILPEMGKVWEAVKGDAEYNFIVINRGESVSIIENSEYSVFDYYLDPLKETYSKFATGYVPRLYIIDSEGIIEWIAVEKLPTEADTAEKLLTKLKGSGN